MADFSLSSLHIKTATVQGSRAFFESTASPGEILAQVVEVLNDPDESRKERVRALVVLSNLARVEDERDTLLDAVRYLGEPFEQALIEREKERLQRLEGKVADLQATNADLEARLERLEAALDQLLTEGE